MKIITENCVYVQKNDLAYLQSSSLPIPAFVLLAIVKDGFCVNNVNRWEFIKLEGENFIDYFKGLDWIADYNEIKDMDEKELISCGQSYADRRRDIALELSQMCESERRKRKDLPVEFELLGYQSAFLKDFILFKKGLIRMALPDGIKRPTMEAKPGLKSFIISMLAKKKK